MNLWQKLGAVALIVSVTVSIQETRRASRLAHERDALNRQVADLADRVQQLEHGRYRNVLELGTPREQSGRRSASLDSAQGSRDSTDAAAATWLAKVKELQQRLNDSPEARIPELKFLSDFDWVELAHDAKLETDADYRKALGEVRKRAESYFTKQLQSALKAYMDLNSGQWPTDLDQLKTFFSPPVEDTILDRWHIVSKSALPGRDFAGEWVLTEKSPVDAAYDYRWTIDGPGSGGVGPYNYIPSETEVEMQSLRETLKPALDAYAASNEGKEPNNPYVLRAYVRTPNQQAALERFIEFYTTNR